MNYCSVYRDKIFYMVCFPFVCCIFSVWWLIEGGTSNLFLTGVFLSALLFYCGMITRFLQTEKYVIEAEVIQCLAESQGVAQLYELFSLEKKGFPVFSVLNKLKRKDVVEEYFVFLKERYEEFKKSLRHAVDEKVVSQSSYAEYLYNNAEPYMDSLREIEALPSWKAMIKNGEMKEGSNTLENTFQTNNVSKVQITPPGAYRTGGPL